jgi:hypothetical protein
MTPLIFYHWTNIGMFAFSRLLLERDIITLENASILAQYYCLSNGWVEFLYNELMAKGSRKRSAGYYPPEIIPFAFCGAVMDIALQENEKARKLFEEIKEFSWLPVTFPPESGPVAIRDSM